MKRFSVFLALGLALSGCDGDCSVTEASGLLSTYGEGCDLFSLRDGESIQFILTPGIGDEVGNIYRQADFSIPGPVYVGRRETAKVVITFGGPTTVAEDGVPPANGTVDFIIDRADGTKPSDPKLGITIVNLEVRDIRTGQIGVFKGSVLGNLGSLDR